MLSTHFALKKNTPKHVSLKSFLVFGFWVFLSKILHSPSWPHTPFMAENDLELVRMTFLQPHWVYAKTWTQGSVWVRQTTPNWDIFPAHLYFKIWFVLIGYPARTNWWGFFFINNVKEKYFVLRILGGLERVGKGTGYPSRGPEFKSQQPCSGPQSSIMRSDTLFLQAHKQMEQLYT